MKTLKSLPIDDGFRMPGEFEAHSGCILIWPFRGDSWAYGAVAVRKVFKELVCLISESEEVTVCAPPEEFDNARSYLPDTIKLVSVPLDDSWARDYAPTFVKNDAGSLRGINWQFNAWGGMVDGLYYPWDKDDALAPFLCEHIGVDMYDAHHFVLEGGAIHSDGEGTIIVTESCLLSKGRNPHLDKDEIEDQLIKYLGAKKVIWIPYGIYLDETNEHVDNICAFTKPGQVVLAWTDNKDDPQYAMSLASRKALEEATDAKGRKLDIILLPLPKPVCITAEECKGLDLFNGEPTRIEGDRLAASYANFYIANDTVIVPGFDDPNDEVARQIISGVFPNRKVVTLQSREILIGGGNIHCITQQIPKA